MNDAKKILATEATALCHGRAAAAAARRTAQAVLEEGGSAGLPQIRVPRDILAAGVAVIELLRKAGLAASNGEARRLIRGGGARVNDSVVTDEAASQPSPTSTGTGPSSSAPAANGACWFVPDSGGGRHVAEPRLRPVCRRSRLR